MFDLDKTKEVRSKKEYARLKKQISALDAKNKALAEPLMQNVAFMKVTLEDLQEEVNVYGTTEEYQNGQNQSGCKQSAALQAYNATVKNYNSCVKTLAQILQQAGEAQGESLGELMAGLMNDE